MMISLACTVASAGTSKLYPPAKDEAGALRLSQVLKLATREEILGLGVSWEHLLASGLKDSDFKVVLPSDSYPSHRVSRLHLPNFSKNRVAEHKSLHFHRFPQPVAHDFFQIQGI